MKLAVAVAVAVTLAIAPAGCGGAARPAATPPAAPPSAPAATRTPGPLPGDAAGLARELTAVDAGLARAIDGWKDRGSTPPPPAVATQARRQQLIYRRLAARPRLAAATIARLRGLVRAEARDIVAAQRALRILNAPFRKAQLKLKLGTPEPADRLLADYREARARSGVGVALLAAVNLVESSFGRLRNDSVAGAQGPMQFMRATWQTYGNGGDVHDPRDAILGAARLLHAGGAPSDPRGALYRYNPSPLYVTAVTGYARVIRRDPRAYYALYAWPAPVP
jgi:membrane-bound lytic murein transglycosylase B